MATTVTADMVANVWKVLVKAGDVVGEGDTMIILESMKMEIPIECETPGTVRSVEVNEGDVVQEGEPLVVIE